MKCIATLGDLVTCNEYLYLENYDFDGVTHCYTWPSRWQAYRFIQSIPVVRRPSCHVCFNPALNGYTLVEDSDYKEFKRCSSFVKRYFKYFERIGIL